PSAFVRLMDMGVESYLLASSVIGVIGQRLVRSVCKHCAVPDPHGLEHALGQGWQKITEAWPELTKNPTFVRGTGCDHCIGSGYRARQSICETLPVDVAFRHLVSTEAEKVMGYVGELGMRTLKQDGILAAARGETTL